MKTRIKRLFAMLIGLLISTSLVSIVHADDDDGDGVDDKFERENARLISFDIESNKIEINSISKEIENVSNEINYVVELSDGIKIQISFENESGSGESELEFEIYIDRIFEFIDNGDGYFNEENDTVIQEYLLKDFTHPQYREIGGVVESKVFYINTTSQDGVFTLHLYVSEQFEKIHQSLLAPTEVKIDFEINEFPYIQGDSQLSLAVQLEAEEEYEEDDETEDEENGFDDDEDSYKITTENNYSGFFSWKTFAIVDGIESSVNSTVETEFEGEEITQLLYFTYERGNSIYHDPKTGLEGILKFFYSPSLWLIIGIVSSIVILSIFGLMMSKTEYREFILNRVLYINKGVHMLSVEEVFENEMRNKILDLIIDEPGIHYKELFRKAETSASNLAWHLDILETYKIIKKARVGNYLVFYPYIDKNPFADFNQSIAKSKTALEIFEIIGDNPGTYPSKIANRMELDHRTVKYHIDKLSDVGLIRIQKKGRKLLLYTNIPEDSD
ncbi:MAG: hypothetical protein JW776_01115 [Candidatus Lokiarchaeota archaeon]|nr:hypothetical protein [Candidatus Lokiarchaeota archaeon]